MFARLPILLIDCQTTGTRPDQSHIVEVAWSLTSAEAIADGPGAYTVESTLVRLPDGATFPRAAQAVSGLSEADLVGAPTADEVWTSLRALTEKQPIVAVAHYARFEEAFLRRWAEERDEVFPFEPAMVCTHRFAKRLLPGLPSAALRAVAGFLGRDLPELRRARENVEATAWIWERLVARFEVEEVSAQSVPFIDVAELRAWIDIKPKKLPKGTAIPVPRVSMTPRETRLALPDTPGIYRFLSRNGRVLYVGKATSLKDRVNSYYRSQRTTRKKLKELMSQVHDVRVTEVATDVEAALLETDEIKHLMPPYNIAMRGQRTAPIFCARDFSDAAQIPDLAFPLGPFASVDTFDELHALITALETGERVSNLFWGMVEEEVILEGLEVFRARHRLSEAVAPSELLTIGAKKWARDAAEAATQGREAEAGEVERIWDAAEVADSLERRLARLVRTVRGARWRCRLTDATLVWEVPGRGRRCLELRSAKIVESRWLEADAMEPVPETWRRSLVERQGLVLGESFDRMRVALTELRRVASTGKATLRLGPGRRTLSGEHLARALDFCR